MKTSGKFSGTIARVSTAQPIRQTKTNPLRPKRLNNNRIHKEEKMETQTESQQPQTQSENAMDRFIRKTRALFAKEPDLDKRWNALRPILAELLADPQVIAASKQWPDCVPAGGRAENLLFYEDPDYGFAINGLTKGEARQGQRARIPDHAHIYTLYGVLDGRERVVRYDRFDDRSKPDYAEIRQSSDLLVGP